MIEGVLIGLAVWWVVAFVASFVFHLVRDPHTGNHLEENQDG